MKFFLAYYIYFSDICTALQRWKCNIFICLVTRQLLSTAEYCSVLVVDITYEITAAKLPLIVFGTSEANHQFSPMGKCLISTDEPADTFWTLLNGLQV